VYLTAQSLVEDGDISIKPIHNTAPGRGDEYYSVFGMGQSVAAIPLYVAGREIDERASPDAREYFSGDNLGDWGGTVPIFFASLFNQMIAPLVCVLLFMFLRKLGFSAALSFFTTLLFGLGTAMFSAAHEFFQHPLETLMLLGAIYVLFANRERLSIWHALAAGALLAFGILTRANLALAAVPIALYLIIITLRPPDLDPDGEAEPQPAMGRMGRALRLDRIDQRTVRCFVAFALPSAAALAFMFWLNWWRFGEWQTFNPPVANESFTLRQLPEGIFGNLLSPGRSIFLYSPPALLGLFGAREFYRRQPAEAVLFAAISALFVVFYSSYSVWHGGWAWGPRYLLPVIPLLMISSTYAFTSLRVVTVAVLLGALGLGVQVLGTVVNVSYVTFDYWIHDGIWDDSFLFVPDISPVPTHLKELLHNRNVDLWLLAVRDRFGTGAMLATMLVPTGIVAAGVALLRDIWRDDEQRPAPVVPQAVAVPVKPDNRWGRT
jgi:hypothetical protein